MYKTKLILSRVSLVACLGIFILFISKDLNSANIEVIEIHAQFAADYSDDRILMGASHNVFVGKVIRQAGNRDRGSGPETQYEVEVIENIKGDLQGTVTVNQAGGYKDGILYVMDDGSDHNEHDKEESNLLKPGSTYLLATRYSKKYEWYTVNSHFNASKLLSSDSSKLKSELVDLAIQDEKLQRFKIAYKDEVLIDADVKNNNTRNSYKSVEDKRVLERQKKEEMSTPSAVSEEATQQEAVEPTHEDSSVTTQNETVGETEGSEDVIEEIVPQE